MNPFYICSDLIVRAMPVIIRKMSRPCELWVIRYTCLQMGRAIRAWWPVHWPQKVTCVMSVAPPIRTSLKKKTQKKTGKETESRYPAGVTKLSDVATPKATICSYRSRRVFAIAMFLYCLIFDCWFVAGQIVSFLGNSIGMYVCCTYLLLFNIMLQ